MAGKTVAKKRSKIADTKKGVKKAKVKKGKNVCDFC